MSEKEINKKVKTKKLSKSGIVLIIGISIIAIPCIVFAGILLISKLQGGSPREGSRFDGDLINKISKEDVSTIETELNAISNTESVKVILSEGQLKVYIDTSDSLSSEQIDKVVDEAYKKVTAKLPIDTYFKKTDSAKMYDLQIHAYTKLEASEDRQYKILHKNSSEEKYSVDDMVHPKDEKLVAELEGKTIDKEDTTDENKEGDVDE